MSFVPDQPRRFVPDEKPVLPGLMSEGGKGLLRGASNLSLTIPRAAGSALLGPIGGSMLGAGAEALAKPSTEMVAATPTNEAEKFVGTAGEIVGGSVAGGGAGTLRGALMTGGAAAGGASGELVGGDLGKFLGIIAGSYGTSAAMTIAKKLGMTLADIGAVVGSGFGNKAGIERLATKAVTEKSGAEAPRIAEALKSPTQYVPGAKVTAGEAITEAQMGKPEQFGGAVVRLQRDLYGAKGAEDVLPSVAKQQQEAITKHLDALKAKTAPMREAALTNANQMGGVKASLITDKIDEIASKPGLRASEVVKKSLAETREKITNAIETGGRVDAEDLYTIRKEVGNTIEKYAKETASWDKRLSAGLQRELQKSMDDAIEASGGKGWKEYLLTESMGRKAVENLEDRLKEMKRIQAGVKGTPSGATVTGEVLQPPTLLSRPMMLLNYGLKQVALDANTPVVKRIATAMKDPQEFAKLVKLPLSHPDRKAMNQVLNSLVSTKLDEAGKDLVSGQSP